MTKHLGLAAMLFFSFCLCVGNYAFAEKRTSGTFAEQETGACTGVVKDATTGETIIGASVVVKESMSGTINGTTTGIDGDFTLTNVPVGSTIVVSFIGFETQEVKWTGSPLTITLKADNKTLEEVVVVGYGTQKKVNVTGAVGMVDSKVIAARPVQNVSQALQGVVPGLNLTVGNSGGALDGSLNINIRGTGTIGDGSGSAPLILIDGIEGDLNTVNPNDIESVSVLKDAASASIYGARASFGVILVTTKSGKSGKTNVSYSGNVRFNDAIGVPDLMDSYTFAQYFNRANNNRGQGDIFSPAVMERIKAFQEGTLKATTVDNGSGIWQKWSNANGNTDWFDEFYDSWVPSHEHNLSISGGSDKTQFVLSGSILDQKGLIRHGSDKFQRYTLNGKIKTDVTDWFSVMLNTKWTREDFKRPTYLTSSFFHNLARKWPVHPAYDPNGFPMDEGEVEQMENGGKQNSQKDFYTNQLQLVFEPIQNWRINLEGSVRTTTHYQHWEVLPVHAYDVNGEPYYTVWDMGYGSYASGASRVDEYSWKENYYTTNIYSDYFKQFDNGHYLKAMVGFNAELYKTRNIEAVKNTLISPDVPTINTATSDPQAYGAYNHTSVAGFFARLNWNYKNRYMFEANGRYDGSSRFVGDKRWGFFPSFSAGWNIAQEDFFNGVAEKAQITSLKLRASWGQLGNTNTNDAWYPFYQTMPTYSNYSWLVNGSRPNYAVNPGMVSTEKTWETVETWDVGLDWGLFNNRLTGSFDYFVRYTYDMIGPAPELSSALGTTVPKINNCDMKSYGFELELGWRDKIGDFSYGVKAVLSDDQQEIIRYPNETKNVDQYYKGRKLGDIWGLKTIGIANSQEEMDAHLAKVDQSSLGSGWGAGDIMYADRDNNGAIDHGSNRLGDTGDYRIIGNNTPRFKYGLTLDAAWKGWDFRVFFQGVGKRDLWLDGCYFWGATDAGNEWQSTGFKEHWDFWRPEGDPLGANLNAYYPKVNYSGGRNTHTQTRYLQNGAYLRMKNIQLGYSFPQEWIRKVGMSSLRVYVSADNLWTVTNLSKIFDPEATGSMAGTGSGKLYPLQRVVSFGVNVNF